MISVSVSDEKTWPRPRSFSRSALWFSMMPLCTTETEPVLVRVRVLVRRSAVRGPARVADADLAREVLGLQQLLERGELAAATDEARRQLAVGRGLEHGDAGGIVASVLEPAQSLDEDRHRLFFTDVTNDSAHRIPFV